MNDGKNRKKGIKGSIVALITPFDEEGAVDYVRLKKLIKRQINEGTDGILLLGETGEEAALTKEEQENIIKTAVEESRGRVPVIANSGSNNTEQTIEKSKKYGEIGADGLLVATPYYNKSNHSETVKHFYKVADNVNIPIYICNVPAWTGTCLSIDIAAELSKHTNIAGIKEDGGSLSYVARLTALINEDFNIYSGSDDITAALMSMGAAGTISVWANLMPAKVHEMTLAYLSGDTDKGRKIQLQYLKLINALFCKRNPAPVKEIMNIAGLKAGDCKLPPRYVSSAERRVLNVLYEEFKEDIVR